MKKTIRVGVIGLGGIAVGVHIPGILASGGGTLSALCDIDREKLTARQSEYSINPEHCFENYKDLIDSDSVDAVCICTPNDCHCEIAQYAKQRHKPFAIEKPIAINKEQASLLYKDSDSTPHLVCFSYRFKAAARYARSLVQSGMLGRIYHVYGEYHQSWGIPDATLFSWRFDKARTGSGVLGDLGCHMLDLIRFTVGEISEAAGSCGTFTDSRIGDDGMTHTVDVDDYFHSLIKLENGATGTMTTSRFSYGRGNYQRLCIYGEKGAIMYNLEQDDTLRVCYGDPLARSNKFVELGVPSEFRANQMQEFIDICNGNRCELSATLKDGYQVQILLDTLLETAMENSMQQIEIIDNNNGEVIK